VSDDSKPPFDAKFAQQYVGKYVLVGMSYYSAEGQVLKHQQVHGVISWISEKEIVVDLKGTRTGERKSFPPDIRSLKPAPPGEYTLRETQEVIHDPDYLWTWDVKQRE
jgi:hypothetical protein